MIPRVDSGRGVPLVAVRDASFGAGAFARADKLRARVLDHRLTRKRLMGVSAGILHDKKQ